MVIGPRLLPGFTNQHLWSHLMGQSGSMGRNCLDICWNYRSRCNFPRWLACNPRSAFSHQKNQGPGNCSKINTLRAMASLWCTSEPFEKVFRLLLWKDRWTSESLKSKSGTFCKARDISGFNLEFAELNLLKASDSCSKIMCQKRPWIWYLRSGHGVWYRRFHTTGVVWTGQYHGLCFI